ncbi:MAG TPA: acylphosphatase [Candidatus Binatia bacterium]|jgi:acylphosphatase|nr:acylphosphatase [Candidatus Binatia bacterium]
MEKSGQKTRVRLRIQGRVQGVYFRASAQQEAIGLGIKGWVRNCADGSVEVLAEGEKRKVEDLVSWCHHGPPGAHVYHVEVEWQEFQSEFENFRVTR